MFLLYLTEMVQLKNTLFSHKVKLLHSVIINGDGCFFMSHSTNQTCTNSYIYCKQLLIASSSYA